MVSRNILLLAAALQVPVTVWLQGCKSDKKKTEGGDDQNGNNGGKNDDQNGNDDTPKPPATPDELKLFKIDIKETMQAIHDSNMMTFETRAHLYSDTNKVTGIMLPVLPLDYQHEADQKVRKSGFAIPGKTHDWLVEEFQVDTMPSKRKVGRARNLRFPFAVDPEEFTELTAQNPNHHVLDARALFGKSSAETYIVTNVEPEKRQAKAKMDYTVVTEVYSAWKDGSFAANNPKHLATTLMPLSTDLEFWYYIVQRAFSQVMFLNASIRSPVDAAQKELFKNMLAGSKKDAVQLDIWTHLEDTREKREHGTVATEEKHIVDTHDGSNLPQTDSKNAKFIEDGKKQIQGIVEKIRAHIEHVHSAHFTQNSLPVCSDTWVTNYGNANRRATGFTRNDGSFTDFSQAPWEFDAKWSLENPKHYEQMMQIAASKFTEMPKLWNNLWHYVRLFYKEHEKIPAPTNADIVKAGAAQPGDYRYLVQDARYGQGAIVPQNWCPSGFTQATKLSHDFEYVDLSGVGLGQHDMRVQDHWTHIAEDGYKTLKERGEPVKAICIPTGLYQMIIRPKQFPNVVPKDKETWEDFEEMVNDQFGSLDDVNSREVVYYAPRFNAQDSLSDYLIEELDVVYASQTHEHINAVTMLGVWAAVEQATATKYQTHKANAQHTSGVLAPSNKKEWDAERSGNKYNRYRYEPYTIDTVPWHANYCVKKVRFVNLSSQSGKTFEAIKDEYRKNEVDVQAEVKAEENSDLLFVPAPLTEGVHKARFAE